MATLVVMRGLPASGKSYTADTVYQGHYYVSRDMMREQFGLTEYLGSPKQESAITKMEEFQVRTALRSGFDVVVDDMNLRARYVKRWQGIAAQCGAAFKLHDLTNATLEECLGRNANRGLKVPQALIEGLHKRFIKGQPYPMVDTQSAEGFRWPYEPNGSLPKAILVDIDGTIADHDGVRSPYDTSKYSLDRVNPVVRVTLRALCNIGYYPIFCSGRSDDFRAVTAAWLHSHTGLYDFGLIMRPSGDTRSDDVVKYELFDRYIRANYNVLLVLDDRDRVVDMWREIGLTVFQVAPGDF